MPKTYSRGDKRFFSAGNETLMGFENTSRDNRMCDPILPRGASASKSVKTRLLRQVGERGISARENLIKAIQRNKAQAFIIHGPDDRELVLETLYPYNVMCYLQITLFDGRSFPATGFFIAPRCVITAGHCVFERNHWVKEAEVIPGVFGELEPHGKALARRFRSVEGWTINHDSNFDYGAIILDDDHLFTKLKSTLGFKRYDEEKSVEVAGYPKDKGRYPWKAAGDILRRSKFQLFYEIDTEAGNSGSPILAALNGKKYAIGLHTDGAYPNKGIYLRQEMLDRWSEWTKL